MQEISDRKRGDIRVGHPIIVLWASFGAGDEACWRIDEQTTIPVTRETSKHMSWRQHLGYTAISGRKARHCWRGDPGRGAFPIGWQSKGI
jgi:hypothetical protein